MIYRRALSRQGGSGQGVIEAAVQKRLGAFALDAAVADAGFVCLAGRNGAGKSTLMRIVAGLLKPDSGRVRVNGRDVTDLPVERRGVVMVTPGSAIPTMEVDAHLRWGARLKGAAPTGERLTEVKRELGIDFDGRVGRLSLGMRERVSLATALLAGPAAILVDEAFSNLHGREEFIAAFRALAKEGGTDVFFSTQDPGDGGLAEHLYALEEGRATRKF